MKFTRINSHTVNCIITADDMDEQGLTIEDFFQKKE
ncbi:MAG: adaptor protein MecA, partial [Lachnospiraceae bacterium]|nr:adaptor protein MecA [Lachnospiraceae bacterium]